MLTVQLFFPVNSVVAVRIIKCVASCVPHIFTLEILRVLTAALLATWLDHVSNG